MSWERSFFSLSVCYLVVLYEEYKREGNTQKLRSKNHMASDTQRWCAFMTVDSNISIFSATLITRGASKQQFINKLNSPTKTTVFCIILIITMLLLLSLNKFLFFFPTNASCLSRQQEYKFIRLSYKLIVFNSLFKAHQ